jgi:hypothetical protein
MRAFPAVIAFLIALGAAQAAAGSASAAQVCAWMKETTQENDVRHLELWLQSDTRLNFTYEIGGDGLADASGHSNSPSSGSFNLQPGQAETPWSFGATFNPPGRIDVTVTLHAPTPSIFDPPGPVIAAFIFRRDVGEGERAPPPTLAARQCVAVVAGS